MAIEVIAQARTEQGTGASRRLRRAGRVPGVVYGSADNKPQAISLDHNMLYHALQKEVFHASILALKVDDREELALLRDAQYHPWRQQVVHIDFQRVDPKQKIHLKVPLHFLNAEECPGVKMGGGIISHVINEVEVFCLPADLPAFIAIDLARLEMGHSIHLSHIALPNGVELPTLTHGNDATVATVLAVRGGAEETETPAAAADAGKAATSTDAKAADAKKADAKKTDAKPAAGNKKK